MQGAAWSVNSPTAVSEVIDGELVVINLEKGSYYASLGVGAYVWQCLEQHVPTSAVVVALEQTFGIARERAQDDLLGFLAALSREGLIRPARPDEAAVPAVAPPPTGTSYAPPELKVYSDMQDLLLLDPIHDVSDEGWPSRPTNGAQ